MGLVSKGEIAFMQESVRECIKTWDTSIILLKELPIEEQSDYDELLREYNGSIGYEEYVVPAERYDQLADYDMENKEKKRVYGSLEDSLTLYHVPDDIEIRPTTDMFVVDGSGDIYYIERIAKRIGMYILHCKIPKEKLNIDIESLSYDYRELGWL